MPSPRRLARVVRYDSPVTGIKKTTSGVKVSYTENGTTKQIEASYCVIDVTLLEMLKKIPNDLSSPFKEVIDGSTMGKSSRLPWESRRFWETDYNIYGGLSFLAQGPSPVWYPSSRLMHPTGIVVAGYMDQLEVPGFAELSLEQKFAASRASVEKIHPGCGKELQKPIYCCWGNVKWNEGSWIETYGTGPSGYDVLLQSDGPIYFAGDTISHIIGWQEGAALSARRAVSMISDKVKSARVSGAKDINVHA
jgi:monoamine oxidase